jgi:hypothetical protein
MYPVTMLIHMVMIGFFFRIRNREIFFDKKHRVARAGILSLFQIFRI